MIIGDADQYDEFFRNLRQLDQALITTIKDLRSQIVREASITVAFMSLRLTNRFERTAEGVIPAIMNLIQNSAKIMATSGVVAMHYIVQNTHASKLVPLILAGAESKSKEIRRYTIDSIVILVMKHDFNSLN
jgi:CLIP-associating protein 1/2